jgi:transposase
MKKVDAQVEHEVLRPHLVDGWPIGTIARELRVHHDVVRRVLDQRGAAPAELTTPIRDRMIDVYLPFVEATLEKYPRLHASRLFHMVKDRGYPGSESHFRRLVARLRPRPAPEPFARLDMPPGEQAQVDWGHFGTHEVGRARRPLHAFVVTLSWSRMVWLQFFYDMERPSFLRGHIDAFGFFGGVPRKLLYDNMKSACIEREGSAIRFNESLLEMASHYGFEPIVAAPRRGNEKGRVERTIRYVRTSFFAAREFRDIADLNRQATEWSLNVSAQRRWQDDDRTTVGAQFQQECKLLRPLPPTPHEAVERLEARVGRTPFVRFDTNDYSLPCAHVRRTVTVLAEPHRMRVVVNGEVVAEHERSFDRRVAIEDPAHTRDLKQTKRRAREGAGMSRLTRSAPAAQVMLKRAAQRGENMGGLVAKLLELLDIHGAEAMEAAVTEANANERVGASPVRMALQARLRAQGRAAPRPVQLTDERLRDISVPAADLSTYDRIPEDDDAEDS